MSNEFQPEADQNNLAECLQKHRKVLRAEIPSVEEAELIAEDLNFRFGFMEGMSVEIDAGQKIIVGDGIILAIDNAPVHDYGLAPVRGLITRGVFQRFDVLQRAESLTSRGGRITYLEPCVVYIESPKLLYRIPEPKLTEMYVPLFRLIGIVELEDAPNS